MSKTIKIRYKHGDLVGDPVAFNSHGAQNGFPRLVNGGDEMDIPADLLDDKEPFKLYKFKDKTEKFVTEKEYRQLLYDHGGYSGNTHFHEAAPMARSANVNMVLPPRRMDHKETVAFLMKQKGATLKYKYFNPCVMELISEEEDAPGKPDDKDNKKAPAEGTDISKLTPKQAVEYIRGIKSEEILMSLSIQEDRSGQRPAVISAIESQLKTLRNQ